MRIGAGGAGRNRGWGAQLRRAAQRAVDRAAAAERTLAEQQPLVRHLVHRVEAAEQGMAVWRLKYWEEHGGAATPQAKRARVEVSAADEMGCRVLRGELAVLEKRHQALRGFLGRLMEVIKGDDEMMAEYREMMAERQVELEAANARRAARETREREREREASARLQPRGRRRQREEGGKGQRTAC
jgi:hypothetical protein